MLPEDMGIPENQEFLTNKVKEEDDKEQEEEEGRKGLGAQIYIVPEKGVKRSSKRKEDTTLERQHELTADMQMGEVPEDLLGGMDEGLVPITSKMNKPKKKAVKGEKDSDSEDD